MAKRGWMRIVLWLVLMVAAVFSGDKLEKVSVQMSWKFQFEYAGFIAAKEKGFYREAGLDVELREYQHGVDTVADVLNQRATYGLYNTSIVVENGHVKPIVMLGTYFQRSPLIFVARKGIRNPAAMVGKTIMGTKDEFKYSTLGLLLNHFGVTTKNARFVDHTFNVDDFMRGKVDVMSVFRSNELYYLDKAGVEYEIIDPAEYGFVMSAVNLFTSPSEALGHTERTQRFIDATNRGWDYALEHPDEIIDILLRKYTTSKSKEALEYEADVTKKLLLTDFYKVGEVNPELTVRAFKQLSQAGMIKPDQKLGQFMFTEIAAPSNGEPLLSTDERAYLLYKKKITMCVDPEWYPFEALRDGKHIGIAADVMHRFEKQLGVPIELVPTGSWNETLFYAQQRRCDIFSLASSTPVRLKYMDFTRPYVTLPIVMATTMDKPFTEDITTLLGKRLGTVKGYSITEQLKADHPELELVEVDSITEGLKMVEEGELYGYIDNLMVVSSYIQKEHTGQLKVSSRLEQKVALGVGTRNDEPILHEIFDKLVKNLDEQTMQTIYNRWVTTVEEVPWIDRETVSKALVLLTLVLVAFGWHYYNLKRYNMKLLELSVTDKLTGLFNRQKTDEKLVEEKNRLQRYPDYHCSVLLIDIDFFKTVNDTYGHQMGDTVLKGLADLFKTHSRQTDVIGRWGGEEFMVILPHMTLDRALVVAENLRRHVEDFYFETDISVTISIGVGEMERTLSVHENIARIDSALYQAKALGRNRIAIAQG
ncbi:MAG: diguanylate cyclase [Campylobacterales bacterium]|nr:diguanylate cyclase [Campylobacterales bacterium]